MNLVQYENYLKDMGISQIIVNEEICAYKVQKSFIEDFGERI
jgi:hypothetical protein